MPRFTLDRLACTRPAEIAYLESNRRSWLCLALPENGIVAGRAADRADIQYRAASRDCVARSEARRVAPIRGHCDVCARRVSRH